MQNDLLQNLSLAGVVSLILFLFGVAVANSPPNESAGHVASVRYETCDHCKIEVKEERGFWDALRSDPIAFFTMTLFLATVALAWITIGLYKEAKRASFEQSRLTREALGHADRSAKAAEDAIVASAESGKIQLRAYLSIKTGTVILLPKDGQLNGRAKIIIKNEGSTPAHEVRCYCSIDFGRRFDVSWNAIQIAGTTYIFPRSEQKTSSRIVELILPSTPEDKFIPFVHGRVEYKDVFGETRTTYFRFEVYDIDLDRMNCELAVSDEGNYAT